jgi:hypothetical protein
VLVWLQPDETSVAELCLPLRKLLWQDVGVHVYAKAVVGHWNNCRCRHTLGTEADLLAKNQGGKQEEEEGEEEEELEEGDKTLGRSPL